MKLFLFSSTAAAALTALCADWQQQTSNGCSLSTECCTSQIYPNSSVPQCDTNPPTVSGSTSVISQETYTVAGDGTYSVELLYATGGGSCPLASNGGTVFFRHVTTGTYTVVGSNTDVGGNWTKVQYNPKSFVTSVVKANAAAPFTAGTFVQSLNLTLSPCMQLQDYLNNPAVGCPCNGTWMTGAGNSRAINASACPMASNSTNSTNSTNGNSTMSSCPENNFFNTAPKYGNVRVTNTTDTSCSGGNNGNNTNGGGCRLLEVTRPVWNSSMGYNDTHIYATFIANQTCPSTLNSTTLAPTAHYNSAGRTTFAAVFYLAAVWVLAWAF